VIPSGTAAPSAQTPSASAAQPNVERVQAAPVSPQTQAPAVPAAEEIRPKAIIPDSGVLPKESPRPAVRSSADKNPVPTATARAALKGASSGVGEARRLEAAGGDGLAVHRALDKIFDASAPVARSPGLVAGRVQGVREAVAQKVSIANTASPADAPDLYKDAVKTAKDALPAGLADGVARVVRGFALRKAEISLPDLAAATYEAASAGSAKETRRLLSAFDKWESLLGAPGRPLVKNLSVLKSDVASFLEPKTSVGRSAPHVWFERSGASWTARIPGVAGEASAEVAKVPSLAAGFAVAALPSGPEVALAETYRAFASDPRASTGAGLVYRARRMLGSSVPSAALSAGRFWLRAALEAVLRRIVSLIAGVKPYQLAEESGRQAVRRDGDLAREASTRASEAALLLASPSLSVVRARVALDALSRAAAAFESLTGEKDARLAVAAFRDELERFPSPSSSELAAFVSAPGGPAHWAALLRRQPSRELDARFWRGRGGLDFLNLGSERSPAATAAARAKRWAPSSALSMVAADDRLWARGRGLYGEVRFSADIRSTDAGGGVTLLVEKADATLAARLEALGLTIYTSRAGLTAVLGPEDLSRNAEEVGLVSASAVAAALGADLNSTPGPAALKELAGAVGSEPAVAAALAARLDGRAAFAGAPVIGLVGGYEAVGPVAVVLDGKPAQVAALRDPDSGLLVYARALRRAPLSR